MPTNIKGCDVLINKPLSRKFIFLLAMATGGAVASNYYAQPLLHTVAVSLQIDGLIITVTQISYALGLFALAPLGDVLEWRRLIIHAFTCHRGFDNLCFCAKYSMASYRNCYSGTFFGSCSSDSAFCRP
jgi:MFS family permease